MSERFCVCGLKPVSLSDTAAQHDGHTLQEWLILFYLLSFSPLSFSNFGEADTDSQVIVCQGCECAERFSEQGENRMYLVRERTLESAIQLSCFCKTQGDEKKRLYGTIPFSKIILLVLLNKLVVHVPAPSKVLWFKKFCKNSSTFHELQGHDSIEAIL